MVRRATQVLCWGERCPPFTPDGEHSAGVVLRSARPRLVHCRGHVPSPRCRPTCARNGIRRVVARGGAGDRAGRRMFTASERHRRLRPVPGLRQGRDGPAGRRSLHGRARNVAPQGSADPGSRHRTRSRSVTVNLCLPGRVARPAGPAGVATPAPVPADMRGMPAVRVCRVPAVRVSLASPRGAGQVSRSPSSPASALGRRPIGARAPVPRPVSAHTPPRR